jgi:hypothetical protein
MSKIPLKYIVIAVIFGLVMSLAGFVVFLQKDPKKGLQKC